MKLEQLQAQLELAFDERNKGNLAEAERLATEVLDAITTSPEKQENKSLLLSTAALRMLGFVDSMRGDYPHALERFNTALKLSEQLNDRSGIGKTMNIIGNVYADLSDYPRALEYYSNAIAIHEELFEKSSIARVTCNIGVVYVSLSDYQRALEYYSKALAIHEELCEKRDVARVTGNIGNLYTSLSDYPNALEYYYKALTTHEELGDKSGAASIISNLGVVYFSLSDYTRALEYLSKALSAHEDLGNKNGAAVVTGNIGNVYADLSDYTRALEYYSKALAAFEELDDKSGVAAIIGNIGALLAIPEFDGYEPDKAEVYLLKAIAINEQLGTKKNLYENHKFIAELYEQEERWKESQQHFKKYYKLEKEVQSEEVRKQAERLDYERKTAAREKQIAIERTRAQEKESILNNILPEEITNRLIKGENPIADHFDCVSILFMDIVEFTKLSTTITAQQLVHLLNAMFKAADGVMRECGLEKIKTIGDAYMAVAGAPTIQEDHAERAAQAAVKLLEVMKNLEVSFLDELGDKTWIESIPEIEVRIGIHCGPVAAGVVGENKFLYDLWGDAVNTASRMESHGEAGKIHVSEEFKNMVGTGFTFTPRGEMEIKGKGRMQTYFLEKE